MCLGLYGNYPWSPGDDEVVLAKEHFPGVKVVSDPNHDPDVN